MSRYDRLFRQVRPLSVERYVVNWLFAPNRTSGRAGSIANDASLSALCPRVTLTFAPPSGRVLRIVWTVKW